MNLPTVDTGFPNVKLVVNSVGHGILTVDGIELRVEKVEVTVAGGQGTRVRFEMLANVECEIAPEGVRLVVTEVPKWLLP